VRDYEEAQDSRIFMKIRDFATLGSNIGRHERYSDTYSS
jgi:hypothetical protein